MSCWVRARCLELNSVCWAVWDRDLCSTTLLFEFSPRRGHHAQGCRNRLIVALTGFSQPPRCVTLTLQPVKESRAASGKAIYFSVLVQGSCFSWCCRATSTGRVMAGTGTAHFLQVRVIHFYQKEAKKNEWSSLILRTLIL